MDEEELPVRHRIGINATSLEETDVCIPSAEEVAEGDLAFAEILKCLPTDRQKFIALALFQGWNHGDIAFMLSVTRPYVTQLIKKIRIILVKYQVRYRSP